MAAHLTRVRLLYRISTAIPEPAPEGIENCNSDTLRTLFDDDRLPLLAILKPRSALPVTYRLYNTAEALGYLCVASTLNNLEGVRGDPPILHAVYEGDPSTFLTR